MRVVWELAEEEDVQKRQAEDGDPEGGKAQEVGGLGLKQEREEGKKTNNEEGGLMSGIV